MITKIKKNRRGYSGQNLFFSVIIAVFISLTIFFLIVNNIKVARQRAELRSKIEEVKAKIEQSKQEKQELEKIISQSENKETIEKIAREQLNLKKPGEGVIVVKKSEKKSDRANEEDNRSFWDLVKDIFNY
ncbi:MAG TPA: septum formation initiator family protein [Candidatus Parcubacteria bacterium]|nr:septum formation initiator family protein [Candidatus Parcubacteria bacterium]